MTVWQNFIRRDAPVPEWPYPIKYGQQTELACDVLVVGGGVAGCRAAISAASRGAKVILMERGHAKRSGSGGAGVDHWHGAVTNPCSKVTPLDYTLACYNSTHGYTSGIARYIICQEGWDTLRELEDWGVQIRDVNDEFKGADFRDETTRLMFAYDYDNRHILRVWGYNIKPVLYNQMKKLGITILNRTTVTSLLTENGRQGTRVIGATGLNSRTGEFYAVKSRATVIATGGMGRLFLFAPELTAQAAMSDMNNAGAGQAVGWNAGAEMVLMEQTGNNRLSGLGYTPYSMGGTSNTYHGTPIVDANGKELPWYDTNKNELKSVPERFRPGEGQKFQLGLGIGIYSYLKEFMTNDLPRDLPDRILKGEYVLPLYADLTLLPESERRVIFGMMVGNEGKTRVPIYQNYTRAGFDPDKDMLQAPVMPPYAYQNSNFWGGTPSPHLRGAAGGGYLVDWDLRTSLEGLYAAGGSPIFGSGCHGEAHTTGRFAGRKAADFALSAKDSQLDNRQVAREKERVMRPLKASPESVGWKELNAAIARVMGDYCGQYKNEYTLKMGLRLLHELKENEANEAYAANPHELGRLAECFSLLDMGECLLQSSLARKCSSVYLDFHRLDYPQMDPPEWEKLLPVHKEKEGIKVREMPLDYHLRAPYAGDYDENYNKHK
ncbi:MAG TPA: FAD-dependent oxidoreductase [Dehalococcoidales bacterium]|nr:FAD-dependent oxidoreductase [Dehalococcoidales bacterium]